MAPAINRILLTLLISLMSLNVMAQQSSDLNKPTRSRVTGKTEKSKKTDAQKDNKAADSKNADKPPTTKPADKSPVAKPQEDNAAVTDTAAQKPQPAKPKKEKESVDPSKVQFDGIDISKHQGAINWEDLKNFGKIKYIYIRATVGSNMTDPLYKDYLHNARKHGFKVGSYHYFTPLSSARAQFKNFITIAKREDQDLLPVVDVEEQGKWSNQQLRDSLKVFVDLLEDYYGVKPMIYSGEIFFRNKLGLAFKDYPLFIAKYNTVRPNVNCKWVLWQFSESGKFSAIKANHVDLSRFNDGCTIKDITYSPGKHKPKASVKDAVASKDKPDKVAVPEQKTQAPPQPTARQQEDARKQAEKEKQAKKKAEETARKKAEADEKAKADAEKKAKAKAEQEKREKARQEAAQKEAEEKAKRKAAAQKARQQKTSSNTKTTTAKTTANFLSATGNARLTQSQRNDSIRNAQLKGRKINKSSADND